MSSPTEDDAKAARLEALRSEHADLDYAIAALALTDAGVDPARIYADVAASGAKDYNIRNQ